MKTGKIKLIAAALLVTGLTCVTSCKKTTTTAPPATPATNTDTDQSGAKDNNTAEAISSDIVAMGSEASDNTNANLSNFREAESSILSCALVTRDTLAKKVVVTFNGSPCVDGKTRSGSLTFDYSGSAPTAKHYRDPGFKLIVTSNNYAVDNNTVTIISKTIVNTTATGFNPANTNETWTIAGSLSIALAGGGTITWTCARVKTLLNTSTVYVNAATPIAWASAKVGISGSASGTRANNEIFSVTITNQLIRDFGGCNIQGRHPFIQGTLVYTPQGKAARTFDYGSGTCDLNATVTINGVTYQITL